MQYSEKAFWKKNLVLFDKPEILFILDYFFNFLYSVDDHDDDDDLPDTVPRTHIISINTQYSYQKFTINIPILHMRKPGL